MPLNFSDRIKRVGFCVGALESPVQNKIAVFNVNRFSYDPVERENGYQVIDGQRIANPWWIELFFTVYMGYAGQQVNIASPVVIASTSIAAYGYLDAITLRNALRHSDNRASAGKKIWFFPMLENGNGELDLTTRYLVTSQGGSFSSHAGRNAGFTETAFPVEFMTVEQLDEYPEWMNRLDNDFYDE